ncbi:hypothetical protein [Trujillonella humicola]|uniref:hypothetical protein n=1 Tax=Trujillonella humicola TaxID=3383699 RepID=UPI00390692F6
MTADLLRQRSAATPATAQRSAPAPPTGAVAAEPADRQLRYWDHEIAAWRPCPTRDGC